jgi:hypothetical protein
MPVARAGAGTGRLGKLIGLAEIETGIGYGVRHVVARRQPSVEVRGNECGLAVEDRRGPSTRLSAIAAAQRSGVLQPLIPRAAHISHVVSKRSQMLTMIRGMFSSARILIP